MAVEENLRSRGDIGDDANHQTHDKMADNNNTSNEGRVATPSSNNADASFTTDSKRGNDGDQGGRDKKRGRGNGRESGRGRGRGGSNHGARGSRAEKGRGEWRFVFEKPYIDF